MKKAKVTVVGAGNVGATAAQRIVEKQLADVVLIDIVEGLPQGKALDMMQSAATEGFDTSIIGTNNYDDTAGSDVVVITAGIARKPGMSRDDLLNTNANIVGSVTEQIVAQSPDAIIIVVSNPLDVMTQLAWQKSGLDPNRVFGMAGVLDSSRYACFIAEALNCSIKDVRPMVLGGHGDTMVPVPQYSTVNGIAITELLDAQTIDAINDRTRHGGAEIVKYLKTGSAFYAPSASSVAMVEAVLLDSGRILPCCALLQGQYGVDNLYCGVPVELGREGVRRVIELDLNQSELSALQESVSAVKALASQV
ncbi:MAG: malate dehydrogenase [Actinobacteria bacterium]|nr:malate dehydrogenase [Actinomycetota bacterium]|tara:strand:- start:6773 stop:7696 length:924 start_codon:yes stop_codon:yes gene_type:complete